MHKLRNLNVTQPNGNRFLGIPYVGTLGSAIPSTGLNGPAPIYDDLTLPGDAGNEYSLQIQTWPSAGSLFMYEDSSFVFVPPTGAGTYSFTANLWQNGVDLGVETITIQIGALTVNCEGASTVLSGAQAQVLSSVNVTCGAASVVVSGAQAGVSVSTTVNAGQAAFVLAGAQAVVSGGTQINCGAAGVVLTGSTAQVLTGAVVVCSAASLVLAATQAQVTSGAPTVPGLMTLTDSAAWNMTLTDI